MQAWGLPGQRLDMLREQREAVFIQRVFDARSPLHLEMSRTHRRIRIEPGVHPISSCLLVCVAGRVSGLLDRRGGCPALVHGHQTDAGADVEAPVLVDKAEVIHALANLFCASQCLR